MLTDRYLISRRKLPRYHHRTYGRTELIYTESLRRRARMFSAKTWQKTVAHFLAAGYRLRTATGDIQIGTVFNTFQHFYKEKVVGRVSQTTQHGVVEYPSLFTG
jgi:hypothetical protein